MELNELRIGQIVKFKHWNNGEIIHGQISDFDFYDGRIMVSVLVKVSSLKAKYYVLDGETVMDFHFSLGRIIPLR